MSHVLQAFIASAPVLREATGGLRHARVVNRPQGFGLLPVSEEFVDEIATAHGADLPQANPYPGLDYLTPGLAALGQRMSRLAPVAYVETEYFGGLGTQAAVVWEKGTVVYGPLMSESEWEDGHYVAPPLLDWAINQALRRLGVRHETGLDEFDTLGLGQFRDTENWLAVC